MNSILIPPGPEDFWLLLRESAPVPRWPRRFTGTWPDPRNSRQGVEYPVPVEACATDARLSRLTGETPWLEVRLLRLTIEARDYDRYAFEMLVVPITKQLFDMVRSVDSEDFGRDVMAWHWDGGGAIAFVLIELKAQQIGSAVWARVEWNLEDGAERHRTFTVDHGHTLTVLERQQADRALKMAGQLVNNMTLRGRPGESRDTARQRLLKAALVLLDTHRQIDRNSLSAELGGLSIDGVADLLSRAGWNLKQLQARSNKTHASGKKRL